MVILSIETSCDETAICLLKANGTFNKPKFKILGNTLLSQIDIHKEYGGVFPALAKREHSKNLIPIFEKTLKEAGLFANGKSKITEKTEKEIHKLLEREPELREQFFKLLKTIKKPKIDCIAVTYGPGLEPALWVGINFAKALSMLWQKPLVPVNHMEGHLLSPLANKKTDTKRGPVKFPALALLISGGHSEFVLMKKPLIYKRVGETRDDAVGEAFDKVARMLGLQYPGGPKVSALAKTTRDNTNWTPRYPLPRPMLHTKDLDMSFSGLKTAVLYTIKKIEKITDDDKKNIAREFEDSVIEILVSKTRDAIKKYRIKSFLVGGGVIANQEIRNALENMIKKESPQTSVFFPEREMSTDNAIMIAVAGYFRAQKEKPKYNKQKNAKIKARGSLRI
ncbi:MAG: tRNA (adenosine(37)-N6)-threonylcarbamoyltransferase complex transferase subunit TsaD [Patescibacteria group bacterium]